MTEQIVRRSAASLVELLLEIVVGAWLLLLFALALAWDPLDRRLGFHAKRHAHRLSAGGASATVEPLSSDSAFAAYAIGPTSSPQAA